VISAREGSIGPLALEKPWPAFSTMTSVTGIMRAMQDQEGRVVCGSVDHRAGNFKDWGGSIGRAEDAIERGHRIGEETNICLAEHVDHCLDAAGLILIASASLQAVAGIGYPKQRNQVPSRAASPGANALRIEIVGHRVSAQIADGALHILDHGWETVLRCKAVVDGGDEVATLDQVGHLTIPSAGALVSALPSASVNVDRHRPEPVHVVWEVEIQLEIHAAN